VRGLHPGGSARAAATAPAARELAQRQSGSDEVLLLWHPDSTRVELVVRDVTTGVSLLIEVAPARAIDAFYHPFAYLTRGPSRDG
jgi:hypothetical protein